MSFRLIIVAASLVALSGCIVRPYEDDRGGPRERVYERHDDRDRDRHDDRRGEDRRDDDRYDDRR